MTDQDSVSLSKQDLRRRLRRARRDHAASLDPRVAALVLSRPPAPLKALIPADATIGLYCAARGEAPAHGYARHFHEAGHVVALPWFAARGAAMEFRRWQSPWLDDCLVPGPYGVAQPPDEAAMLTPDVLIVPLVGFTARGARLGQGGGHYDRWLAAHGDAVAVGLAWDCQLVDDLPNDPHDRGLTAVITPTRLFGPFDPADHG